MKNSGLSLLILVAALFGIYISFGLIEEDILSTAYTLFEYFPATYGVTPSTTFEGALWLGRFVTVAQIVASGVAFNKKFGTAMRSVAGLTLLLAVPFDNWTDTIHRSGWGAGDATVAIVTTLAFYTFGSEILQGLSWMLVFATWRAAVSDVLWGSIRLIDGVSSIGAEVKRLRGASQRREQRDLDDRTRGRNQGVG